MINKMKIGITVREYPSNNSHLNGMKQHAYFFSFLLKSIGHETIYIITETEEGNIPQNISIPSIHYKKLFILPYKHKIDLLIQWETSFNDSQLLQIEHIYNCPIIQMQCGPSIQKINQDLILHKKSYGKNEPHVMLKYGSLLTEYWIANQFNYFKQAFEAFTRTPVVSVPYIYENIFVEKYKREYKENPFKENIRLVVSENNQFYSKTSFPPLLIIEEFGKMTDKNIEICFCSSRPILEFIKSMSHLSILDRKNTSINIIEHKIEFQEMIKKGDIFISFSENQPLNYLLFDMFSCNIPIIHNSPLLKKAGYYYEGWNVKDAAFQIQNIIDNFMQVKDEYYENNMKIVKQYSIEQPAIKDFFKKQIESIPLKYKRKRLKNMKDKLTKIVNSNQSIPDEIKENILNLQ